HEVGFQLWAQFLPQLNPIAAGLAGATGVGLPRYIVIASAAAMAWAGTWIAVGYLLADVLTDAVAYLGVWIVVLIALAVVAFGAHGYRVALLSRHPATQEPLVTKLPRHGIISAAFRANARDRESIASGLAAVKQRLGAIDVLEFSPADRTLPMPSATELTHESVR